MNENLLSLLFQRNYLKERVVCEILLLPNVKLCKLPTSMLNGLKVVAGVVRKLGNAIQWINRYSVITWFVLLTLINWIAIYPVDSVIQPSSKWGLITAYYN